MNKSLGVAAPMPIWNSGSENGDVLAVASVQYSEGKMSVCVGLSAIPASPLLPIRKNIELQSEMRDLICPFPVDITVASISLHQNRSSIQHLKGTA